MTQETNVIGEAVREIRPETRERLSDVPWASIAGLRNIVVHEYFRVDPELILDIVDNQCKFGGWGSCIPL